MGGEGGELGHVLPPGVRPQRSHSTSIALDGESEGTHSTDCLEGCYLVPWVLTDLLYLPHLLLDRLEVRLSLDQLPQSVPRRIELEASRL